MSFMCMVVRYFEDGFEQCAPEIPVTVATCCVSCSESRTTAFAEGDCFIMRVYMGSEYFDRDSYKITLKN